MLEPVDLVVVEGVVDCDLVRAAVRALAHQLEGHTRGEGLEADDGQPVYIHTCTQEHHSEHRMLSSQAVMSTYKSCRVASGSLTPPRADTARLSAMDEEAIQAHPRKVALMCVHVRFGACAGMITCACVLTNCMLLTCLVG